MPNRRGKSAPLAERFAALVTMADNHECWTWLGAKLHDGRGCIWHDGRMITAPRAALLVSGVDVPPEMFVCHHCDNPNCVNPAHLFVGTHTDNMRDASAKGRLKNQTKTHCRAGHPLSGDNLTHDSYGGRRCKICHRENQRRHDAKRRAAGNGSRARERRRVDAALGWGEG
jgi:HNH endonuclease